MTNESVLRILKDVVKSKGMYNSKDEISLKKFIESSEKIINSYKLQETLCKEKINFKWKTIDVILTFGDNKEEFEVEFKYDSLPSDTFKFKYENNDLILVEGYEKSGIIELIGNDILNYYKFLIKKEEKLNELKEFKITDGILDVNYVLGNINYDRNQIIINILDYLCIDKIVGYKYNVKSNSLNITNFVLENIEGLLNGLYIEKDKCPKLITDYIEKEQRLLKFEQELKTVPTKFNDTLKKGKRLV